MARPWYRVIAVGAIVLATVVGVAAGASATGSHVAAAPPAVSDDAAAIPDATAANTQGWVAGFDVSYWQGEAVEIAWDDAVEIGARFAYVKSSEGSYGGISTRYVDQRKAAAARGLYTGAYHFANPNPQYASGAEQARLFAEYSAEWNRPFANLPVPGQKLLPPMIDLEWNPYPEDGDACYGLTPPQMVAWIHDFVDTATELFGRPPVIYTNTPWWVLCTGDSAEFGETPLSIADWSSDKSSGPDALPASWSEWTFWQHGDAALDYTPEAILLPGDQQYFAGSMTDLEAFATGELSTPER